MLKAIKCPSVVYIYNCVRVLIDRWMRNRRAKSRHMGKRKHKTQR